MPNWNHIVREYLAVLRLPPEREIEIVEEQALHLEAAYEDALAAGLSEAEAEALALRNYDWRLLECELSRAEQPLATWGLRPSIELTERKGGMRMGSLLQDIRCGARCRIPNRISWSRFRSGASGKAARMSSLRRIFSTGARAIRSLRKSPR